MRVSEILESALYVGDLSAAESFYTDVLGLTVYSRAEGRHVFLQCGQRMVLLFNAGVTCHAGDGATEAPAHGAQGTGHIAFAARDRELDGWAEHLDKLGIEIEKEISWGDSRSIYFRDPSGNSIEITSPKTWAIAERDFFQGE